MELEYLPGGHLHPQNIINKNFDTVKSEFTDSGTTLAVTSGVTPDGAKPLVFFKEGRWVHFFGGGTFPTTAGTLFLILPAGYHPIDQDVYWTATVRDSDTTRKCVIQIMMNGECRIITNTFSGNPIFLDTLSFRTAKP